MSGCRICGLLDGAHHHECPEYRGCTGHTGECGCICKWCGHLIQVCGDKDGPDLDCERLPFHSDRTAP